MKFILALILALCLPPVESVAMKFAGCKALLLPIGPDTVAIKWVCPTR